ncbi:MAG TPA: aspartate-semialdehyde dehydrogenase [Candidatus Krumholzibacteria bacterium]|nr:aspartate-semialdehyde dehydrogenase [Candidatus Krumholzibacteria bacterium]HPD72666.1 aspartate-semialdehyde dehydrogenase [Candidatus Krumholzibacteria bacterium]HRY40402.1 aspartate-semialdehyde dehydrogenase [Candidatus Krumholzibacteria bacterium]
MRSAILGASGLVGRTMLDLLARQSWIEMPPLLLTSARSAGQPLRFRGSELICREVAAESFASVRVALFSAGATASRRWAPVAAASGAWVVDNSSAWRREASVPLVVPEVNGRLVPRLEEGEAAGGIIANPNCSTIQIALPCAALDRAAGLREVHVTTMQSVSGAGQKGRDELAGQSAALAAGELAGADRPGPVFPRRIAANVIPEIGGPGDDGFFEEERKVHDELRKILARPDLAVTCTATRVPVWTGHSAAVRAVLSRPLERDEAVAVLGGFPGVTCGATPADYRTPAEVSGDARVHVGRLRHEPGRRDVLLFWVVADNLLKGAAWNAVQIAARLAGAEAR